MTFNSTTTLNRIRGANPCEGGWTKLLKHLGKTRADDEPLDLLTVLDSNGLDDALWVLSYAMPDDRLARHFQAWCAEQVLHLFENQRPGDTRVRDQIAMLCNDDATDEERDAARLAARAAVWIAAGATSWATGATRAAVWAATRAAARDAARDAGDAAWAAARGAWAAWDAAAAAQEKQLRKMLTEERQ